MKQQVVPDVSVVIATYNHAPFVRATLESVLAQAGVTIEVLVADDGSKDGTPDAVRQVTDPRLHFVAHPVNRGACVVTNELIKRARGEFVAVMNSDDVWLSPNKLKFQVDLLRSRADLGASFGRVEFIDRDGALIPKDSLPWGTTFDQPNRTQGEWLRRFFEQGNCLCHPSVLIRRRIYDELGLLDNRLRQLPDFDMWIRLIKAYPIHVSEHAMVGFRILPGENASSQTPVNAYRTINEHLLLAMSFFDGFTPKLLIDGFSDLLHAQEVTSTEQCQVEGLLMMLGISSTLAAPYTTAALLKLNDLLGRPGMRELLMERYRIDDRFFQTEMGKFGALRPDLIAAEAEAPLRHEVARLSAERDEACSLRLQARKEVARANEAAMEAEKQLAHALSINEALKSSRSWRITAPVRAISRLLRGAAR